MKFQKKVKQIFMVILTVLLITGMIPGISPEKTGWYASAEAASNVKLNKTSAALIKGQVLQLKISGTKSRVTWSSSNKKAAVVSSNGKVTAKAKGTAVITAKAGSKKYNCRITVETPKISKTSVTLYEKASYTLKLLDTKQKVTWKSSRTSVAVVSSGKITAKKAGTATITASVLGKKYSCKVTVKAKATTVKAPVCAASQTMYAVGMFGGPWASGDDFETLSIPDCFIYIGNLDAKAKVTDVKSSNPKLKAAKRSDIDAIEVYQTDMMNRCNLVGMSSTISFKVKQNGKTYSLSCRINVKKRTSPVASLKVGTQDAAKYFDGYMYVSDMEYNGKQKVTVKMASGYVLDSLSIGYYENGKYKNQTIKNGSAVDFSKCKQLTVSYHTTRKPVYYKDSAKWYGVVPSALHDYCTLILE